VFAFAIHVLFETLMKVKALAGFPESSFTHATLLFTFKPVTALSSVTAVALTVASAS